MIHIDKNDALYKYLNNLGIENVDEVYVELAKNGRYKLNDVRAYFREEFQPSNMQDIEENELEKILDYYVDLKKVKHINSKQLKDLLKEYKDSKSHVAKEKIINSQLKDVLFLCLNYSTLHKNIDIQDLVQIANIGLIDAIEKYNPSAKLEFKDYMVYWIRERVLNEFKEKTNG